MRNEQPTIPRKAGHDTAAAEQGAGRAAPTPTRSRAALAVLLLALVAALAACASEPATGSSAEQDGARQGSAPQGGVEEPTEGRANFDPNFTHGLAEVDGGTVHYVRGGEEGSGPPLVLIHGWPQTWWEFHEVMPELAENRTVIAVDLPGLGDSSASRDGYGHRTAARMVRDTVASLGYEEADVMAHDIGLWVGYRYARDYPDEVNRLMVMEAPLPGFGPKITRDPTEPEVPLWHFSFHDIEGGLPERLVSGNEAEYLAFYYDNYALVEGAVAPEDRAEFVSKYRDRESLTAGFDYYRNLNGAAELNRADAQPRLDTPILAVGGEGNFGLQVADAFRNVGSDVRGVVAPGSGHWVPEEKPEFVVECANAFFGGRTDGTPEAASSCRPTDN